jgi:glycerophosphoryl diester phosphodiesterase
LIIAHRGARRVAPENSLPAITRAAELGADRVEIDVRLTKDGVPVVLHDATVQRTTDGVGRIGDLTWHQARKLRLRVRKGKEAPADMRLPTLESALDAARTADMPLVVELKSPEHQPELVTKTLKLLKEAGMTGETWIWSFNWRDLRAVHELAPRIARGTLSMRWPRPEGLANAEMVVPFAGHQLLVRGTPPDIGARPVIIWTVNQPWMARRFAERGVAGLITDVPDRLRALFPRET